MVIEGLEIRKDGIVHENENRKVFEVFNDDKSDKNSFLAKNERAFIVKRDSWIGDHYRDDWEYYSVLAGEAHWFFEDMKTGKRENHIVKVGGKVKLPPNVAIAIKAERGTIIIGRYKKTFQELKTNKYILEWARKKRKNKSKVLI